eukprot:COSAG02_NODE_396_length_23126_cov_282.150258_12_plen_121_part_00
MILDRSESLISESELIIRITNVVISANPTCACTRCSLSAGLRLRTTYSNTYRTLSNTYCTYTTWALLVLPTYLLCSTELGRIRSFACCIVYLYAHPRSAICEAYDYSGILVCGDDGSTNT